ncbi:MAG: hypothetical protein LKM37_03010 [Bacteroidales bacterium]|jgi:hypothetical protein|nr:hypothetical protein [Bacteroidales bacterium]
MNKTRTEILKQLKALILPHDGEYKEFNARIVFGAKKLRQIKKRACWE